MADRIESLKRDKCAVSGRIRELNKYGQKGYIWTKQDRSKRSVETDQRDLLKRIRRSVGTDQRDLLERMRERSVGTDQRDLLERIRGICWNGSEGSVGTDQRDLLERIRRSVGTVQKFCWNGSGDVGTDQEIC